MPRFVVTADHLALLGRMNIGFDRYTEFGAPCVDPKRPYGNSDVYGDMREILGRKIKRKECDTLHHEMETVLQILVYNLGIKEGMYESDLYRTNWTESKE